MTESLSAHPVGPGATGHRARPANQTSWTRWLPGLNTLRHYESSWLRHDLVAGLVLTTMLVPVGIAYAEASGVPGIYGLYATIVPLLAYALFGPSRILVLRPRLAARRRDPRSRAAAFGRRPATRGRARRNDGDRLRRRVRCRGLGASGLHHRAAVEADPLRLHERHRADGAAEPSPEAVRLLGDRERPAAPSMGNRRQGGRRKHEPRGAHDRRRHARAHTATQALAARARHLDRRGRGDRL